MMNINQEIKLTCLIILVSIFLNSGCSSNRSTKELGYYYVDEENSENRDAKKEKQQSNESSDKEKSSKKSYDWGYYISPEEDTNNGVKKEEPQPEKSDIRKESASSAEYGNASYYADKFQGRSTASGELYDREKLTAAHRTHPFGTLCKVTNLTNGKSVTVRINDRGPHVKSRVIDVSYKAMSLLDGIRSGIIKVKVEVVK